MPQALIDETGNKYGRLAVKEISEHRSRDGKRLWLCECSCGNTCLVTGGHLRDGHTKSCGCLKSPNETGNVYGLLTVLRKDEERSGKGKGVFWICQCACGNTTSVRGRSLRQRTQAACSCMHRRSCVGPGEKKAGSRALAPGESKLNRHYSKSRYMAGKRGLSFHMTREEWSRLYRSPCYYCGIEEAHGIDRVNNQEGYTVRNTVACCKICNQAKHTLTYEQFYKWAERIAGHWDKLSPEGPFPQSSMLLG